MEITKGNIHNPDALWKWIKRECEVANVESLRLETFTENVALDNTPHTLQYITGRELTIKLGPDLDYSSLRGL